MTKRNFVRLQKNQKQKENKKENQLQTTIIKPKKVIQIINFEIPEYLDYQEKNFLNQIDLDKQPLKEWLPKQ